MGIYWNRDPKSEPEAVPAAGPKAKPARQIHPPLRSGRGWVSVPDPEEPSKDPAEAGDRRSRKR